MDIRCVLGRHRWVTGTARGETGRLEEYQQCARCRHYPRTGHWSGGEGYEPPGGETSSASAPSGY